MSHSHHDKDIVHWLVELLRLAFRLDGDAIRATSVGGAQLTVGSNIATTIVRDVQESDVMIALVTPASLQSSYVQFELGARWGAKRPMLPLLSPRVSPAQLPPQLRDLQSASLDRGIPSLIDAMSRLLDIPVGPAFIDANSSLIERARSAAVRLYPDSPTPLPFESAVSDPARLSSDDVVKGAKQLWDLITDGGHEFVPDLLVALNQGGMIAAAMLKRWMPAHVGVALTDLHASRSVLSLALPPTKDVRRVLLVDTKLKSGGSASNVAVELQRRFECEVRLAALLAYGPWNGEKWSFPNGVRWPAVLRLPDGDLPTYVAYHLPYEGERDPVQEPWRDDIILPTLGSAPASTAASRTTRPARTRTP